MDKERAVESFAHQIAAAIHFLLAERRVTVSELKNALGELPNPKEPHYSELVDDLLSARNPHKIHTNFISDVAFVLNADLRFSAHAIDEPHEVFNSAGIVAPEAPTAT